MKNVILDKIKFLPFSPGVYIFKDRTGAVLYVGKATSLKDRVGSYFQNQNGYNRPIEISISLVKDIEVKKTDTVLEAFILEQELIKKMQPKYNAIGKDDRSFCYVLVTKEDFPRFVAVRETELAQITNYNLQIPNKLQISKYKIQKNKLKTKSCQLRATKIYGPYTSRRQIETALKILRKIFPYHSMKQKTEKGCLDFQLGKCPGPYAGAILKEDYIKNIRGIRMILEGKKKNLIYQMKKEMNALAKEHRYEKAAEVRNKIFLLEHIQDIALISNRNEVSKFKIQNSKFRIEGYDISNISGKYSVGSMVVFDNSESELKPNKNEYRKFRIKTLEGANDIGAMHEVLMRRFKNNWAKPNLIIIDGGKGHLNMARSVLRIYRLDIPILAVAKGPKRKKLDLYPFGTVPKIENNIIEQVRDEAHRFAISYYKKLHRKSIKE